MKAYKKPKSEYKKKEKENVLPDIFEKIDMLEEITINGENYILLYRPNIPI